ncbi:MAG: hypothetical protein GF372_13995 [Candidatus Marinimicrobia bacterium]|nr:hypothetical protein [Candidatus Neomarinimicrobiota bacterium]
MQVSGHNSKQKSIFMRILKSIITAAICLLSSQLGAQQVVNGKVFVDSNSNGVHEAEEPGIGEVSVSNGRDVVRTSATGEYSIEIRNGDILFITKPADYTIPVNENNLPQFYYIHLPHGTPDSLDLRFRGLRESKLKPDAINFPLLPGESRSKIRMIALADPQPLNDRELDFFRDDVVNELLNNDADFAVVAGDIMHDDLSLFPRYNRLMSQLGIPVWNIPGNHDLNFESPDDSQSLETFKRFYGPSYYSFDYGNSHFVVLDNVDYLGRGSNTNIYEYRRGGKYRGYISDKQLTWLRNDLQQIPGSKRIVIITHIPLLHGYWEHETLNTVNREDLFRILKGRDNILFLAGHTHSTDHQFIGKDRGWVNSKPVHQHILTTASGSWWQGPLDERGIPATPQSDGSPNGYHIYIFNEDDYSFRYKAAGKPADYQFRVYLDEEYHNHDIRGLVYSQMGEQGKRISKEHLFSTRLVVNVFSGTPRDSVWFSIDKGEWQLLQNVTELPPWFVEFQARFEPGTGEKQMSQAAPTNHLWVRPMPTGLETGEHLMDVKVNTHFGKVYTESMIFEVLAP